MTLPLGHQTPKRPGLAPWVCSLTHALGTHEGQRWKNLSVHGLRVVLDTGYSGTAGRLITRISFLLNSVVDRVSMMLEYSIPGSQLSTLKLPNFMTLEENELLVDREGNS